MLKKVSTVPELGEKVGDGGIREAASVSGNIKQTLVRHGKVLTDEVMQCNKAQKVPPKTI